MFKAAYDKIFTLQIQPAVLKGYDSLMIWCLNHYPEKTETILEIAVASGSEGLVRMLFSKNDDAITSKRLAQCFHENKVEPAKALFDLVMQKNHGSSCGSTCEKVVTAADSSSSSSSCLEPSWSATRTFPKVQVDSGACIETLEPCYVRENVIASSSVGTEVDNVSSDSSPVLYPSKSTSVTSDQTIVSTDVSASAVSFSNSPSHNNNLLFHGMMYFWTREEIRRILHSAVFGSQMWFIRDVLFSARLEASFTSDLQWQDEWRELLISIGQAKPQDAMHAKKLSAIVDWLLGVVREDHIERFLRCSQSNPLIWDPLMRALCEAGRLEDMKKLYAAGIVQRGYELMKQIKGAEYYHYLRSNVMGQLQMAAFGGHLELLKWLHSVLKLRPTESIGSRLVEEACHLPVNKDDEGDEIVHEHVVRWLHEQYPYESIFDEFLFGRAVRCCSPDFLDWLSSINCSFEEDTAVSVAIVYDRLNNLRWLLDHIQSSYLTTEDLSTALEERVSEDMVKFIIGECGVQPSEEQARQARQRYPNLSEQLTHLCSTPYVCKIAA